MGYQGSLEICMVQEQFPGIGLDQTEQQLYNYYGELILTPDFAYDFPLIMVYGYDSTIIGRHTFVL